jgi:hypothetical protein
MVRVIHDDDTEGFLIKDVDSEGSIIKEDHDYAYVRAILEKIKCKYIDKKNITHDRKLIDIVDMLLGYLYVHYGNDI